MVQDTVELTAESFQDKNQKIAVTESPGCVYDMVLRAKLDYSPKEVYDVLTDPGTVDVFRNIKACTYRHVLEEDEHKGTRKLAIGHRAVARFLFLNIQFDTHLHVWEDDVHKTIRFQVAREGLMKRFDGSWSIQPFTQHTLDNINHPHHHEPHHAFFHPASIFERLQHKLHARPSTSLVTLTQTIQTPAPGPVKHLVCRMCAAQIRSLMEDLGKELDRRKAEAATAAAHPAPGRKAVPAACASPYRAPLHLLATPLTLHR